MKNHKLGQRTVGDIDDQVAKILRGIGNPGPPLDLRTVRELLRLDRHYYSSTDDSALRDMRSRLTVAGKQVLARPTLLFEAVRKMSLKALYLPDQKRILIDKDVPQLKHRWNEAHEIGHDIIPWHKDMMLGDTEQTLTPTCHELVEAEANYAAGRLLFMADRFEVVARSSTPSLSLVKNLSKEFGNTITSTLWRLVEEAHGDRPMVALVSGHPHPSRRDQDFDPSDPCRYCVESPTFRDCFGTNDERDLFRGIVEYCGAQRTGDLGSGEVVLTDRNGGAHVFLFETFFNGYQALTLAYWLRSHSRVFGSQRL